MTNKIIIEIDEDLEDIVPGYLDSRHKDIESLKKLLEEKDFIEIQSIGHKMKGSGGGYGFDYISECGKSIELFAKENNADKIKQWTLNLSEYLNNTEINYIELDE